MCVCVLVDSSVCLLAPSAVPCLDFGKKTQLIRVRRLCAWIFTVPNRVATITTAATAEAFPERDTDTVAHKHLIGKQCYQTVR